MSTVMDVIVVGCGAAGVAALRKLHDAGLKAIGLEAADRIGGRILTVDFGACAIDLGAAWCEGDKNNVVFDMADSLDLVEKQGPAHQWFLQSNGELVPEDLAENIVKGFKDAVSCADNSGSKSLASCINDAALSIKPLQKDSKLCNSFVEWFGRANQVGGQSDPKQGKSLKGLEDCWVDRNVMMNWKGRGYKTILDLLLNKYPDPSNEIPVQILLNKEVESIKWSGSKLVGNPLVQVKCKDGSLYAAKSVIVTISIAVLKKRHTLMFNPALPIEKVKAINNIQLCVLGKIYIEFTKPWWPKTPASFPLLWRDEDKAQFSGDDKWVTEIFGLDSVHHQPNLLLAWMYGEGVELMERASVEKVQAGVNKMLDVIFRKQFDVSPVKAIKRTQWGTDALTGGAYSYRSVASEEEGSNAIILSEPLYHGDQFPIVCFAGEATSHHNHSAVHGAVESGFREAERLIQKLKQS